MSWLLDTNVISEGARPNPDRNVMSFLKSLESEGVFLSIVSVIEVERGIARLSQSPKKLKLEAWFQAEILQKWGSQTIVVDDGVISAALDLVDIANAKRFSPAFADTLVAATAVSRGMNVLTRNARDFSKFGLPFTNPWTGKRFNGS